MLTVTDARTGKPVELSGARRGLLTLRVGLLCDGGAAGPADLRALIVADVVRRVAESAGRQVVHAVDRPGLAADRAADLDRATADLGVAPPADDWPRPEGAADLLVLADGAPDDDSASCVRVVTGPVGEWAPDPGPLEPAALRLALLRFPYARDAPLDGDQLVEAAGALARWRRGVAEWSRKPSKSLPGEIRAAAHNALDRDLDTAAVLDLLDHVADSPGFAPGAKFETFAYLDRFLALELPRDIGTV